MGYVITSDGGGGSAADVGWRLGGGNGRGQIQLGNHIRRAHAA